MQEEISPLSSFTLVPLTLALVSPKTRRDILNLVEDKTPLLTLPLSRLFE